MKPAPVPRDELSTWRMVAGNEDTISVVIDEGRLKEWVAIGWIDTGVATPEDFEKFPVVIDRG